MCHELLKELEKICAPETRKSFGKICPFWMSVTRSRAYYQSAMANDDLVFLILQGEAQMPFLT